VCRELAAIVVRETSSSPRRFIRGDFTPHHSELMVIHQLKEGAGAKAGNANIARYEYFSDDGDWSKATARLDEKVKPSWLDEECEAWVKAQFEAWRDEITITGDVVAVVGRKVIATGKCTIGIAVACTILLGLNAKVEIKGEIKSHVEFGYVSGSGSITTGDVSGYGSITTDDVSGSLKTGSVSGSGSITTGSVSGSGSITTGYVSGSITTGSVEDTATVADAVRAAAKKGSK